MHSHNTEDCYELKKLTKGHKKRWSGEGANSGGGRFAGHGGGRGGRGGHRGNNHPRQAQANVAQHPGGSDDPLDEGEDAGGFQEPRRVACIFGGAQAPKSNRHFKQLHREVNAALPDVEAATPLKWSQYAVIFYTSDHPASTRTVGCVPLVCMPTVNNIAVSKTLIDGGAGLNVLSIETFEKM
jgi:hypothetical protein